MPRLTTLFADISESTALFEQYGNARVRALFQQLLHDLGCVAEQHAGTLVKTIGDEALCLFPGKSAGLQAAVAMQRSVAGKYFLADHCIQIRIGLYHGEVIIEPQDVFGDGVNVAARLVALANAGQILTDTATAGYSDHAAPRRLLGPIAVKGKSRPLDVVELLWDADTTQLTSVAQVLDSSVFDSGRWLHMRLGDTEFLWSTQDMPVTIGRDDHSSVRMTSTTVSRRHAVIEYAGDQFVFQDKSSNGSWIKLGGELVRIHRSQVVLFGQGEIHCGSMYDVNQPAQSRHVLHFNLGKQTG